MHPERFPVCKVLAGLALASVASVLTSAGHAASVVWDNNSDDGSWHTPSNWSTDVVPAGLDDAVFINPAAGTARITTDIPGLRDIRFGDDTGGAGPGSGVVNHTSGTAAMNGSMRMGIGDGSTGFYNLVSGTLSGSRFNIGEAANTTGTVNIVGGQLLQTAQPNQEDRWSRIGQSGSGTLEISAAGVVSFDTRTLVGGGGGSTGTVHQRGGTFEVRTGDLSIADNGIGTYNINAGILRTLNNTAESVIVGQSDNSQGSLNVSFAAEVNVGGDLVVANGNSNTTVPATGIVTQTGGVVRVGLNGTNPLRIGVDPEANGTYNLRGGTLDLTGGAITYGAGTHAFNFTGGRLKDVASTNFALAQQGGTLAPGSDTATGAMTIGGDYTLSLGGTLEISLGAIGVSDSLTVNGIVNLAGNLDLIANVPFGPGTSFTIISNDGADPIVGSFADRSNGVPFLEDGTLYTIFYTGGDGNDVIVVPEPASLSLALLGGGGLLSLLGRRRSLLPSSLL